MSTCRLISPRRCIQESNIVGMEAPPALLLPEGAAGPGATVTVTVADAASTPLGGVPQPISNTGINASR